MIQLDCNERTLFSTFQTILSHFQSASGVSCLYVCKYQLLLLLQFPIIFFSYLRIAWIFQIFFLISYKYKSIAIIIIIININSDWLHSLLTFLRLSLVKLPSCLSKATFPGHWNWSKVSSHSLISLLFESEDKESGPSWWINVRSWSSIISLFFCCHCVCERKAISTWWVIKIAKKKIKGERKEEISFKKIFSNDKDGVVCIYSNEWMVWSLSVQDRCKL